MWASCEKRCAGGARSGSHGRSRGKCGKPFPHNSASQATMARKARFSSTTLAPGSNGGRSPRHFGFYSRHGGYKNLTSIFPGPPIPLDLAYANTFELWQPGASLGSHGSVDKCVN